MPLSLADYDIIRSLYFSDIINISSYHYIRISFSFIVSLNILFSLILINIFSLISFLSIDFHYFQYFDTFTGWIIASPFHVIIVLLTLAAIFITPIIDRSLYFLRFHYLYIFIIYVFRIISLFSFIISH